MPDKFTQLLPALGALVAFLVAAVLVLYIFRLLFGRRIRAPGGRNRARRLDIVDAFDLDHERQLVIVRRDNVEHLLLIGGPNDVLVEGTINRLEGAVARPPEQRAGPSAANWPAEPSAPPRELESPLPSPAAAAAVNLPPDLFAPAPRKPTAPPPPPPGPRISSPAAPPARPPARSPTPPFLARAQQRLSSRPKEPAAPPEAAAPPPAAAAPPPASVAPKPAEPSMAPRPAAPSPPPPPPPGAARPPAPPPAPPPKPAPPPAQPPAAARPPAPPPAPPPPKPAPPPGAPPEVDPLDSLEAEMARLLGRPDDKQ